MRICFFLYIFASPLTVRSDRQRTPLGIRILKPRRRGSMRKRRRNLPPRDDSCHRHFASLASSAASMRKWDERTRWRAEGEAHRSQFGYEEGHRYRESGSRRAPASYARKAATAISVFDSLKPPQCHKRTRIYCDLTSGSTLQLRATGSRVRGILWCPRPCART